MIENQTSALIVSHRLRGFDANDASLQGLNNAITKEIKYFEVDCRVTKDGEIVIHHDARLANNFSSTPIIAEKTLTEIKRIKYNNSNGTILTLDELFQLIEPFKHIKIYLDIKENGKEEKIIEAAAKRNLLNSILVVSWLPEVLFKVHSLLPTMQLCFSFYPLCNSFNSQVNYFSAKMKSAFGIAKNNRNIYLFDSYNNNNKTEGKYGFDYEHFVSLPFNGRLLDLLQSVNGIVCVNYKLPTVHFISKLKEQSLQICLYSINDVDDLQKYIDKFHPDIILTDSVALIES